MRYKKRYKKRYKLRYKKRYKLRYKKRYSWRVQKVSFDFFVLRYINCTGGVDSETFRKELNQN